MRFPARPALKIVRIGFRRLPPRHRPPRPFSDPRGFNPHSTPRPYCMPLSLIGFLPFKAFPLRRTLLASSTRVTFSAFPPFIRRLRARTLKVFFLRKTVTHSGVLHPLPARFLLGLFRLHGFLRLGLEQPLDSSSAHDLSVLTLHAESRRWPSASSPQTARHLPLSRAPAVLASLAFLSHSPK